MSDFLLTQIINYGAPIVSLTLLLGALGIPVPATLTVIAAGAFSQQGILSWPSAALIGWISAVVGDSLSYALGYYARGHILNRFSRTSAWSQAEQTFQRWGGVSVFLTRFLITSMAVIVNLIAGTGNYSFKRFIVYDMAGEVIWILGFGYLGYLFGSEWQLVSDFITNFGGLMFGLAILIAGIILAIRWLGNNNPSKTKVPEV